AQGLLPPAQVILTRVSGSPRACKSLELLAGRVNRASPCARRREWRTVPVPVDARDRCVARANLRTPSCGNRGTLARFPPPRSSQTGRVAPPAHRWDAPATAALRFPEARFVVSPLHPESAA